jgi:pimeloyl-ACP methyl ester carboxylesterase
MDQPDLLLLHGALGASDQFDALRPLLDGLGRIHAIDFEGHGNAEMKDRPFSANGFVENILAFMDQKQLPMVDIFGYSMGGHVGLYMALKHPERVRRVFTFATKFLWTPETAAKEAGFMDADRISQKVPDFARALATRHVRSGWKAVMAKSQEMIHQLGSERLLTDAALQNIPHSVRLAMGDKDKMVTLEETIGTYRMLPNAQLQIFPATPHPFEQASVTMLADAIRTFFSE